MNQIFILEIFLNGSFCTQNTAYASISVLLMDNTFILTSPIHPNEIHPLYGLEVHCSDGIKARIRKLSIK